MWDLKLPEQTGQEYTCIIETISILQKENPKQHESYHMLGMQINPILEEVAQCSWR